MAFHWYVGDHFENVKRVHEAFPNTHLLFTEGCNAPFDASPIHEWQWGEQYGISMINDFNNGAEGWTDWNVLLDQQGGPESCSKLLFRPDSCQYRDGRADLHEFLLLPRPFFKICPPGRASDYQLIHRLTTC